MPSDSSLEGYLHEVLVHGLKPAWVEVVEYDHEWPAYYDGYRGRLAAILGDRMLLIEHIGSTSVPGLAAKSVIDIVVGIDNPDDEAAYVPALEAEGYEMRVREPGHRCLRGGKADSRSTSTATAPKLKRWCDISPSVSVCVPTRPTGTCTAPPSVPWPAANGLI